MTTLALKTVVSQKAIASSEAVLGEHNIKSGRYWYKGSQNCDLVFKRKNGEWIVHASGGVRFRLTIHKVSETEAKGSLILLGWLRETPNAIRIILTILKDYSHDVARRRELKDKLKFEAQKEDKDLPEMMEAIGSHFSVKADEERIEEKFRISNEQSDRNFEIAVKSRWYHKSFVNFCKQNSVKCHFRSVIDLQDLLTIDASTNNKITISR
ncbi:MAG: hypothetical protein ACOH5I_08890 [Oligoflexus sp.]